MYLDFVSISERLTYLQFIVFILLWYTSINSVLYRAQQSSLYIYVVENKKIKYIFLRGVLCLIYWITLRLPIPKSIP